MICSAYCLLPTEVLGFLRSQTLSEVCDLNARLHEVLDTVCDLKKLSLAVGKMRGIGNQAETTVHCARTNSYIQVPL